MVLKVISPDIFDRAEVGGRATHVKDEQQLKSEFEKLSKSIKSKVPYCADNWHHHPGNAGKN